MADFNPDRYLAEKAPGFNPDAYLREKGGAAAKPEEPGLGTAIARGAAQGATFGFGDEATGAIQAVGNSYFDAVDNLRAGDWKKALYNPGAWRKMLTDYRAARDSERSANNTAEKAHGGAYLASNIAGGLPAAIASGGAGAGVQGQRGLALLRTLASGAKTGAKFGALAGIGNGEADVTRGDVPGAISDTLGAATVGASLGGALSVVGRLMGLGLSSALNKIRVKPTKAAEDLMRRGVDLTLGQMNPSGILAQLEEAGQSMPITGPIVKAQRAAALPGFQRAALEEARPPVASSMKPGDIGEKLSGLYDDFTRAYDSIADTPVKDAIQGTAPMVKLPTGAGGYFEVPSPALKFTNPRAWVNGSLVDIGHAFDAATKDPNILATDAQRAAARAFLENQQTIVNYQLSAGGESPLTAESLLKMRSNVRGAIRDALKNRDYVTADLMSNAEASISKGLDAQLSPEAGSLLRATDAKYRAIKVLEDAIRRSGDQPDGFTPSQLSVAVKSATERASYARGDGGALRDMAAAGKEVLDQRVPPTGARLLAAPFGAVAPLLNLPLIKEALVRKAPAAIDGQLFAKLAPRLSAAGPTPERIRMLFPEFAIGDKKEADEKQAAILATLRGMNP